MTRVKICGITTVEDALHAVECGADALGFVFYSRSPRAVSAETVKAIVDVLPPFITTVGLFVNEKSETIREIASFCGLDVIQLHGDESPADCILPPHRVVKALRVKDESSLANASQYKVSALLLDAWVSGTYGGTGHAFNWDLASEVSGRTKLILAGGLSPDNVSEAVRVVRPYAVDVSSGVEMSPGKKDPGKVKAFIRKAKQFAEG